MWSRCGSYRRIIARATSARSRHPRANRFDGSVLLRCVSTTENNNKDKDNQNASKDNSQKSSTIHKMLPKFLQRIQNHKKEQQSSNHRNTNTAAAEVIDMAVGWNPSRRKKKKVIARLPKVHALEEFPHPATNRALRRHQATVRILKMAAQRLGDPPTLHLLAFSFWATLGIAAVEGTILCQAWPLVESAEAAQFVAWYSVEQLIPSITWSTQDPVLVAKSLDFDPSTVLRELSGDDAESATILLRTHLLATTRFFVAGFMMIASIVRAAGVSAGAFAQYEERIRQGQEPPLRIHTKQSDDEDDEYNAGIVIRFCGKDSYTTEVSLQRMGVHIFPVFEYPDRVQYLVWNHSEQMRRPVYWCVREGKYGSSFSWDRFSADACTFIKRDKTGERILVLEADATNPHDPLALGNAALDLTLDDASQGFRRMQERYTRAHPSIKFETLRVYLGNSMEIARTGGGHSYTLRHRVKYAKEVDVLIDSRAPVLQRILEWCSKVASGNDRRILFQTSSRDYFNSLQKILRCYGYELYDPLDLRVGILSTTDQNNAEDGDISIQVQSLMNILMSNPHLDGIWQEHGALDILNPSVTQNDKKDEKSGSSSGVDEKGGNIQQPWHTDESDMLRHVAKMARLPRLVHMPTTAETVNAVEALITAGEVDATNCCAILERQEGVSALEYVLQRKSDLVRDEEKANMWINRSLDYDIHSNSSIDDHKTRNSDGDLDNEVSEEEEEKEEDWKKAELERRRRRNGLQMICTSTIYDDLFRQVRMWTRMGFSSAHIQREMDLQFHEILEHSHTARKDDILEQLEQEEEEAATVASDTDTGQSERNVPSLDSPSAKL